MSYTLCSQAPAGQVEKYCGRLEPGGIINDETMSVRERYTDANFYHGFPNCAEVHHEIETFIYFQILLLYSGLSGSELALNSIIESWAQISHLSKDYV